jgi:hypothetical protein
MTSITIKGETIPIAEATVDLEAAAIKCLYSEQLSKAFAGWMPVDVQLNLNQCRFSVPLRVIDVRDFYDVEVRQQRIMVIEFDGPLSP